MKLYVKKLSLDKQYSVDEITNTLFTIGESAWFSNMYVRTFGDPIFKTNDSGESLENVNDREKFRSFDDIILIYRTYRPHTSISQILLSIEKYILIPKLAVIIFCPDIKKWVLYNNKWSSQAPSKYLYVHNYGRGDNQYDDSGLGELSLRNIFNYMNKSKEDRLSVNIINKSNNIENTDSRLSVPV